MFTMNECQPKTHFLKVKVFHIATGLSLYISVITGVKLRATTLTEHWRGTHSLDLDWALVWNSQARLLLSTGVELSFMTLNECRDHRLEIYPSVANQRCSVLCWHLSPTDVAQTHNPREINAQRALDRFIKKKEKRKICVDISWA